MSLRINDEAPNFTAETTQGSINFHEWIGNGWAILFSHPKDFTPVCTTELGYMAGLQAEFAKRNCKIIGLSVDPARRGKGYGYALLQRGRLHAQNLGYKKLYMHCLSENQIMIHLARKAGMQVVTEQGETISTRYGSREVALRDLETCCMGLTEIFRRFLIS